MKEQFNKDIIPHNKYIGTEKLIILPQNLITAELIAIFEGDGHLDSPRSPESIEHATPPYGVGWAASASVPSFSPLWLCPATRCPR